MTLTYQAKKLLIAICLHSKSKYNRLRAIRFAIKQACLIMLFPWLMAFEKCALFAPSAPPPPPYYTQYPMSNSNDFNQQVYEPYQLTKKQAKNKAKQYLETVKKAVEESGKIIHDMQVYHLGVDKLDEAVKACRIAVGLFSLQKTFTTKYSPPNQALSTFTDSLKKSQRTLFNLRGRLTSCSQVSENNLKEAKKCIERAQSLQSKKKAQKLYEDMCILESNVDGVKVQAAKLPIMNEIDDMNLEKIRREMAFTPPNTVIRVQSNIT